MTSTGTSVVWEALGCLAGVEWTALFFWCLITFSLCLVLVLLISLSLPVTIKEDEGSGTHPSSSEQGQPPQGLDVFQQLFSQKLLPIDSRTGWQLTGVHHELRSWQKEVELGECSFMLHGSCAVISSHSQGILDILKDIARFTEWDPDVTQCSYISMPASTSDDSDNPLMADVVSLTLSRQRSVVDELIDRILTLLAIPYNYFSKGSMDLVNKNAQKPAVVARSWRLEEDMSCWMFSRMVFKGKGHTLDEMWSYSIAQPATNEPNRCVMHHIFCSTSSDTSPQLREKAALRLAALKQYFELQDVKVNPLSHTSLAHLTRHAHNSRGGSKCTSSDLDRPTATFSRDSYHNSNRRADRNFLPIYSTLDMYDSSRRDEDVRPASQRDEDVRPSLRSSTSSWQQDSIRKSRSAGAMNGGTWQDNSSSDDGGFYSEKKEVTQRGRRHRVRKTVSADPGGATGGAGGGDRPAGRKTMSLERGMVQTGSGDLGDSGIIDNLSDYQTTADQGAELVLRECLTAASINVNAPEDDQRVQTGGWSFHCLEKDVVILKRAKRGKYYSFLGKGIIKASPETVFKAIRNPRTRFTYDTMLKKLDIVKNLSDDLCIYHMVHEVPQFLKKESRDFCVMEVAKSQGNHHIVAFRSVDWAERPETQSLSRGHILPSGWVIEPVAGRDKQYSMVTYITHFALCGKDVPSGFSDFLSVRVPLSVAYLRLFLEAHLP